MIVGALIPNGETAQSFVAESVVVAALLLLSLFLFITIWRLIKVIDKHWELHHAPERATDKLLAKFLGKDTEPKPE